MARVTAAALQRLRDELAEAFQGGRIDEFQWRQQRSSVAETTDGPDMDAETKERLVLIRYRVP